MAAIEDGEYKEENYAGRLCLAIDKEQKALIMFENDLVEGSEVQLMQRNIDFKYIPSQVNKLNSTFRLLYYRAAVSVFNP